MEVGERGRVYIPIATLSTTRMTSCIKMGSDESHFNVSVGSDGQSHKTVSTNHNLFEEKGEPKRVSNRGPSAYQRSAIPLGQTGSLRQLNRMENENTLQSRVSVAVCSKALHFLVIK